VNAFRQEIGMKKLLAFLTVMLPLASALSAQAQEIPAAGQPPMVKDRSKLPHVVIVSMGGTIASRAKDRMNLTHYGDGPPVDPQDWLHDLPELQNIARVTTEDLRNKEKGKGDNFGDIARVAHRLNEMAKDPAIDGIVVTHGTNTMAEVAFYMNLVVNTDKPIVFVGSQRPWSGISGDGPLNMYDAVRVAADPAAKGLGVLHCMNQYINAARDVTKTSAYRVQTFKSSDTGALGFADPDKVKIYRAPVRKHTTGSEFAGTDLAELPPVELFYSYTDAPGYVIDAAVEHGIKGLVIDGYGAGVPSPGQAQAMKRAQAKGVIIVITTRTRGGRVQETPQRTQAHQVNGDDLPPEKARLLLQLALTKTHDWTKVQQYFNTY
jgi:L-asparaginase type II